MIQEWRPQICKDSRAISQAVDAMITRLNSQEDLAEFDLVCLTCLCYALMWVLDTNPSRNGTISEIVRFDLDDLSKEGGEMQSVLGKALAGAKSEVQQDILAILRSRG